MNHVHCVNSRLLHQIPQEQNSFFQRHPKKDRFFLQSRGSAGGRSMLQLPSPINIGFFDVFGSSTTGNSGGAIVSATKSGDIDLCSFSATVGDESVESREGAVNVLHKSVCSCGPGSYIVRILPLATIRTTDSRSSRKDDVLEVLRFVYDLRSAQSILYTCRILT